MQEILLKEIKKTLNQGYVEKFFRRRLKKYFPETRKLLKVKIDLTKKFLGFRNLGLKYELFIETKQGVKKKIIRGRIRKRLDSPYDSPQRAFLVSQYLFKNGFNDVITRPIDYLPKLNLFLYENLSGKSLQGILAQGDFKTILKFIPQIAEILRKLHQIKHIPSRLKFNRRSFLFKDKKWEKVDHRHLLHLAKKYYPPSYSFVKATLERLKNIHEKYPYFFLPPKEFFVCHGDPHLGNFLKRGQKIGLIDFSESVASDPLDDVARFLVQTESMLQYYLPQKARQVWPQIKELFIKSYFRNKSSSLPTRLALMSQGESRRETRFCEAGSYFGADKVVSSQSFRLTFFEIMNLIQMLTNLIFTEKNRENKKMIFKTYQAAIKKRISQLKC